MSDQRPSVWLSLGEIAAQADEVRRTRPKLVLALLAAVILLSPVWMWWLRPPTRARVVIIDKTVPHEDWREHEAFTWWLEHRRIRRLDGVAYDPTRDYVGYHPDRSFRDSLTAADVADAALIYLADTYGVYTGDYRNASAGDSATTSLDRSRLIYGGLLPQEMAHIAAAHANGAVVVAEFNSYASPTWGTPTGAAAEAFFGARHAGWVGRWYSNLGSNEETPPWMRDQYERFAHAPWSFSGEGVVLVSETDDRIVVLTGDDLAEGPPVFLERDVVDDPVVRGVHDGTPYWYWFGGLDPLPSSRVLASFRLNVTARGRAQLAAARFPERFAAVVARREGALRVTIAGELADVGGRPPMLPQSRGIDGLRRWWVRRDSPRGDTRYLLWNASIPVWDGVWGEVRR